jgi:hypothetical protein
LAASRYFPSTIFVSKTVWYGLVMSMSKKPKLTRQEFDELWRADQLRKAAELESIRTSVATCGAEIPDSLRERLLRLFPADAKSVLREHDGFKYAERRDHYKDSVSIAKVCFRDLETALVEFGVAATAEAPDIMRHKNRDKLDATERQIQKELFAAANAAASLVDHSRRLQKRFQFDAYDKKRSEFFKDDGLHELIIGLRVLLHHLHIVQAGWSLSSDFRTGERHATFKLSNATIRKALDENADGFGAEKVKSISTFLDAAPDQLDLLPLFREYGTRAGHFHAWLSGQLEQHSIVELSDYDHCILEIDRLSTRMGWNALVGNWLQWDRVPDLHKHLQHFLTPEQSETVYSMPRNSRQQVDAIVTFLNEFGAVDEPLRQRIYQLFERLSEQEDKALIATTDSSG